MKTGKHQKPRPTFDWRAVDWEAVLLLIICIVVSIVLVIGLIRGFVAFPRDCSSDSSDSNTYSERDETEWIAPEIIVEEIVSSSSEAEPTTRKDKAAVTQKRSTSEPPQETDEAESEPGRIHIGRCRLTIYTPSEGKWGYTTATGAKSQHLMTCAVDPSVIPYGSNVILIKADGTEHRLKAVDCGNFRGKMIDVFFDGSVSGGVDWLVEIFGEEYADVWIEKDI